MKTVYLKDGQEADLIKKIDDNNYIVDPYMTWYGYEGDENTESSGNRIVVDSIYSKPPVKKINKEIADLNSKIEDSNNKLSAIKTEHFKLSRELSLIENQKTDLSKLIINKSELMKAERITVFESGGFTPIHISKNKIRSFKLTVHLVILAGEEKAWSYEMSEYDERFDYSKYVDMKTGFIIDKSDEEILEISRKRIIDASLLNDGISDRRLERINDDLLSEDLKTRKKDFTKSEKQKQFNNLNNQMASIQEKIKNLDEKA